MGVITRTGAEIVALNGYRRKYERGADRGI